MFSPMYLDNFSKKTLVSSSVNGRIFKKKFASFRTWDIFVFVLLFQGKQRFLSPKFSADIFEIFFSWTWSWQNGEINKSKWNK